VLVAEREKGNAAFGPMMLRETNSDAMKIMGIQMIVKKIMNKNPTRILLISYSDPAQVLLMSYSS
jgi:hypothetical protein